jgi:hypothetical protein
MHEELEMSELTVGGKSVKDAMQKAALPQSTNPAANVKETLVPKRAPRVSMAAVRQRLQVPDIPGYRMYWFKDENIPAALDAYYEFVKRDEISTNSVNIGQSVQESGNTDMGTNVSIIAGQNAAGQPVRLNLMKLALEYYNEDQRLVEQRNLSIMEAIFGEEAKMFDSAGNMRNADPLTYRKTALFNRPKRQAKKPGQEARDLRSRLERLEKKFGDS